MSRLADLRDSFAESLPEFITAFPFEGMVALFSLATLFRVYFDEFGVYAVAGSPLPDFLLFAWCGLLLWGILIMTMGACKNSYKMRVSGIRMLAIVQVIRALLIWEGFTMNPFMWMMFVITMTIAIFCLLVAEHLRFVEGRLQAALQYAEQE